MERLDMKIIILIVMNVGIALYNWIAPIHKGTVYVLTPMIDIVPEGNPIDEGEKKKILTELRYQSEARDIQKAYAYLGATLSLHDLLRGIEAVEESEFPLSPTQKNTVFQQLQQAQERHRELQHIQHELVRLEAELISNVQRLNGGSK